MKKHIKIFWPALLAVVFCSLYAISVYDFYSPDEFGISGLLYIPALVFCLVLSPLTGGLQLLCFAYWFYKTRDRRYFYHLYSALLVGLCAVIMFVLVANGFYITV